jgi:ferrochelatase
LADKSSLGVLLVNLGTPDSPTAPDIRHYLAEFLSDPRIVNMPRLIWLPILHGLVLPFQPKKLAPKYKSIWTDDGAPIRLYTEQLAKILNQSAAIIGGRTCIFQSAMTYGNPSIYQSLNTLLKQGVKEILVLPLFPQYSAATTAAVLDKLNLALAKSEIHSTETPTIRFITDYHDNALYITAISKSLDKSMVTFDSQTKVLLSFHGLPQAQVDAGDPYEKHCVRSAELITCATKLADNQWQLTYQSRFGLAPWLKPDTRSVLQSLPAKGIKKVIVVCPGFAVDCLETLEEINDENRKIFMAAGGEKFTYIPALNAGQRQIGLILNLVESQIEETTSLSGA